MLKIVIMKEISNTKLEVFRKSMSVYSLMIFQITNLVMHWKDEVIKKLDKILSIYYMERSYYNN